MLLAFLLLDYGEILSKYVVTSQENECHCKSKWELLFQNMLFYLAEL